MKLSLDILTQIMKTIVVCYWPHAGFGEICYKFSSSKSPWIIKKYHPKKYNPKNYYSKGQSIFKHAPSYKSDFRPNIVLSYLSTCYRRSLSTKTMIISSMRTKNKDFRYPLSMHVPQKFDHIRPQGRLHEKEFKLFSNTRINI